MLATISNGELILVIHSHRLRTGEVTKRVPILGMSQGLKQRKIHPWLQHLHHIALLTTHVHKPLQIGTHSLWIPGGGDILQMLGSINAPQAQSLVVAVSHHRHRLATRGELIGKKAGGKGGMKCRGLC